MAKLALLAAAALTLSMGEADALSRVVKDACMSDYAAYCNGLKVGTTALRSCMKSHRHMLSRHASTHWALRAKSPKRRSDNTSARCTKSKTRSAAAKGLAQVRSRLRRCQTNRANRAVSAIQINHSVVSTLKVPLPIGSHSREPAEAPLGSERYHSTRTPRGTFDGETVVAQKPALGTAKTAGQGRPADGLCACPSG